MRFVPEESDAIHRAPVATVESFVESIFERAGLTSDDARRATESLLIADLRGIESHGIARLSLFCRRLRAGLYNLRPVPSVVRETPSTLVIDADNGFGYSEAPKAMHRCIEKAAETGICFATVRNSNHFGIAGYYVLLATQRGHGAIAMTNTSAVVLPTFGSIPKLGSNPIAIGVPTGRGAPLILDMSTSTVAYGKLDVARRAGVPIPSGWATDCAGVTTTDTSQAVHLLPLGGERVSGGHKGYGLGVMVDALCGPLSGGGWSGAIPGSFDSTEPAGICHAFIAWRIDAFQDPEVFASKVDGMIDDLRSTPPLPGYHEVLVPGDPELAAEEENRRLGIPIRASVLASLKAVADEFDVPFLLG